MSLTGKKSLGIPVILLHDSEGGIVTIEMKNGDTYRGLLDESQDNMNCTVKVSPSYQFFLNYYIFIINL